jgi:hypothetical protein
MKGQEANRVLSRIGARELTAKEAEFVCGGRHSPPHTNTACTFAAQSKQADGDTGECGGI